MGQATLTFNNDGYFYLHSESLGLGHADEWETVNLGVRRTSSLSAAALFRSDADVVAEKVFTRAFNLTYKTWPTTPQSCGFLDPHQREGVDWILSRRRSYLAHAPGAGKTAQAIVASHLIKGPGQTVFIVPPELVVNWEREIWKFTKDLVAYPTIGIVGKTARQKSVAWRADFIIVPDSMLTKEWVFERLQKMKIKLLAVDEASRFKDPAAARSIVFYGGRTKYRRHPGIFQNASHVVMLDGSPMLNRPMELWAPVYAMDPEAIDCMSQRDFGFKYCGATQNDRGQWEFKHSSNETDLRDRLRRRLMHVVGESELNHPERRRSLLFMSQDVRTPEMRAWEQRNLKFLKTDEISEDLSQGEIATYRKDLGIRKIPWIARYILSRMENKNEKILLFCWHREVCIGLATLIGKSIGRDNVGLIIGGTSPSIREAHFREFQAGRLPVIVGNIAAMGRGHNLQRADRVVFGESSWSDELNKQCEKRASRRGRDEEAFVRCEYVVVPGSLDERVMTAVFTKARRVKRVIG